MRMYSASGRSRWPYVIGAAVVVVVVGGVVVYVNNRDTAPTARSTSTSSTSTSPTAIPTGGTSGGGDNEDDAAPTGCLGGQDRDAATVVAAQSAGHHTGYGAVEVAASFYRFIWQYPIPSADDIATVEKRVMASDAPSSFADLAATYKQYPNLSGGVVPDGTSFHLSTTNGIWLIDEGSTADRVTVSIGAGYVINGALSPTKSTAEAFVMQWQDGAWHVSRGQQPEGTRLANGGTRFTGGC